MAGVLTFGDLTFPGQSGGVYFDALGSQAGTDWGSAEGLVHTVEAFLQDGAIAATERFENREMTVRIRLKAMTSADLALGEALLVAERRKCDDIGSMNTLTWTPPDGGPTSVFDVVAARLDLDFDDQAEVGYGGSPPLYRYYQLTLQALPYSSSAAPVTTTVAAPPATFTSATIDDASAATNWTGSSAVTASGGTVSASGQSRANLFWNPTFAANLNYFLAGGSLTASWNGGAGRVTNGYAAMHNADVGAADTSFYFHAGSTAERLNITAGTTYTASLYLKQTTGTPVQVQVRINWFNAAGTFLSTSYSALGTYTTVGSWQRWSQTATAPAGAAKSTVEILLHATSSYNGGYLPNADFMVDDAMYEASGSAGTYFDGSTAPSGDWVYAWTGVANASSSTATILTYLTRSGLTTAMAGTPYLKVVAGGATPASFIANGTALTIAAQSGTSYWLDASAITTLNTLRVNFGSSDTGWVDDVSRTNSVTGGTTGRQNARQITVAGSARSQASLSLADAANALGTVLVYTTTELTAHQPNLRQFLRAGPTVTTDASTVSGATTQLDTVHYFDLPADGVPPGGYLLLARVRYGLGSPYPSQWNSTVSWSASSTVGGVGVGASQTGTTAITLYPTGVPANDWKVKTLALLNLPATRVGTNGKVTISIQTSNAITVDEAWLFNVDTGRLTWVECGIAAPSSGGSSNRLWLDTATTSDPKPSIWRGTLANRADAQHAGLETTSWGAHEFVPPAVSVFTVTTASTAAALTLTHYPRWHTHAAA